MMEFRLQCDSEISRNGEMLQVYITQIWHKNLHIGTLPLLDSIWTSAYFGDNEELDDVVSDNWILYSKNVSDLFMKRGPNGTPYKVTVDNQYEVEIDGSIFRGWLLSELIRNVCEVGV